MFTTLNIFTTVVLVSLLVASLCLAFQAARNFSFRRLHRDRRGVSYTLTMIITLPFYLAMVVGGIELNWLFHANTLFQRATLMTGRSISLSYQQEFEKHEQDPIAVKKALDQRGELAAALVLFSAGSGLAEQELTLTSEESEFVSKFIEHLKATSDFAPNSDTLRRANYTAGATTVEFSLIENTNDPEKRSDRATIKLEYEQPFFSQAIGRYFGELSSLSGDFYVWKFTKEVEFPLEIARTKDKTMGIK